MQRIGCRSYPLLPKMGCFAQPGSTIVPVPLFTLFGSDGNAGVIADQQHRLFPFRKRLICFGKNTQIIVKRRCCSGSFRDAFFAFANSNFARFVERRSERARGERKRKREREPIAVSVSETANPLEARVQKQHNLYFACDNIRLIAASQPSSLWMWNTAFSRINYLGWRS